MKRKNRKQMGASEQRQRDWGEGVESKIKQGGGRKDETLITYI